MHNLKAEKVIGKTIYLRNVTVDDAEFILSLRNDDKKSRFLSKTNPELDAQKEWINSYSSDSSQAYFIICTKDDRKIGTVRVYDIIANSFCWGSWILTDEAPASASIESALIIYKYALSRGLESAHFDVRKGNTSVYRFHERFGAVRVSESENDYFYKLNNDAIITSLNKYKKHMPDDIIVIDLCTLNFR